jgi:hemerythrin
LRYIHRGNYGLISAEEMMQAGVDEAEADELMRIKLKFAFGNIARPEAFVDCLPLKTGRSTSATASSIPRLAHNVFEIRHGDDYAEVDLNLDRDETYPCPYPAEPCRHRPPLFRRGPRRRRRRLGLQPTGDGQRAGAPGAGLPDRCRAEHPLQPRRAGHRQEGSRRHLPHPLPRRPLCRADHAAAMRPAAAVFRHAAGARLGDPEILRPAVDRRKASSARYFDICDLEEGKWNDVMGLEVRPTVSPHPVETTIFTFRVLWEGGYRTYSHLADIVSFGVLDAMINADNSCPGPEPGACESHQGPLPRTGRSEEDRHRRRHDPRQRRDFAADRLGTRLLLAHTARDLTDAERRIGSGAPFGTWT